MKKLIAIVALLTLCSCGSQPSESSAVQSIPETTVEATAETTTEETKPEVTTTEEATTTTKTTTAEATTATEAETATTEEIQETTVESNKSEREQAYDDILAHCEYVKNYDYEEPLKLYEDDNISVTTDWWCVADFIVSTRLIIENKTDKDIVIKSENSSINDFDIDLDIRSNIAAGKKKALFPTNNPKDLQHCGIKGNEINCIELKLKGLDEDDYSELFETDIITIPIEQ